MAKPLPNIIESIKEELSHYKITDDFVMEDEYLIDKVNDFRASLIRDSYRNKLIDGKYYQQLCCLEIECLEVGCEINGITLPSGIVVWYVDLPTMVQDIGFLDIKYLGLMGFTDKWREVSWNDFMNIEANLWSGTKTVFTRVGSRAYIKNLPAPNTPKFACLVGILYNPVDSCDYDENDEYPCPSDITLQMLVKKDIMSTGFMPLPDTKNDGKSPDITDVGGPGKRR